MMSTRFRNLFTAKLAELCDKKEVCSSYLTGMEYKTIIDRLTDLKNIPQMKKVAKDYRILRQYEVVSITTDDGDVVSKLNKPGTQLMYVSNDDLFDAITEIHVASAHGGRDMMYSLARKKYVNVTKEVLLLYADLCEHCHIKKSSNRRPTMERLPVSSVLRRRCQVDVIDMELQPDGDLRYILCYQDLRTNFMCLRALRTQEAGEVADCLIDIFCTFGSPLILQSVNGYEFAREVVSQVKNMWPECILIVGKNTSAVQDSLGGYQSDVRYALGYWMAEHHTGGWSKGLRFIQWKMNSRKETRGNRKSSYNAMFFEEARLGVQHASLTTEIGMELLTEDELVVLMNENKRNMQLMNNPYKAERQAEAMQQNDENKDNVPSPSPSPSPSLSPSPGVETAVDVAESGSGTTSDDVSSNSGDSDSSKRIDFTTSGNQRDSSASPNTTQPEPNTNPQTNGGGGGRGEDEQNGENGGSENGADEGDGPSTSGSIASTEEMEGSQSVSSNEEPVPSPSLISNDAEGESNSTTSTVASQGSPSASTIEDNEERERFADSSGSDDSPRSSMHCDNGERPFDHSLTSNGDNLFCEGCGEKQAVRIMCDNCHGKISADPDDEIQSTAKRIKQMEEENEEQLDVGTGKRKKLDEYTKRRLTAKWNESSIPSKQICVEDRRINGWVGGGKMSAAKGTRLCECKKKDEKKHGKCCRCKMQ